MTHPVLAPVEIRYLAGDRPARLRIDAVSTMELIVAALRDCSKQVTFGFSAKGPRVVQGGLFA